MSDVLELPEAERLAAIMLDRIARLEGTYRAGAGMSPMFVDSADLDRLALDREQIENDLEGLRLHHLINHPAHGRVCSHGGTLPCPDVRRYSAGLRRMAKVHA